MNLAEHLLRLSESSTRRIAQKLGIVSHRRVLQVPALRELITKVLGNAERLRSRVLERLTPDSKDSLKQMLFLGLTPPAEATSELESYGTLYRGVIPDDLATLLSDELKPEILRQLPDTRGSYHPSAFLKAILMGRILLEGRVPVRKVKEHVYFDKVAPLMAANPDDPILEGILRYFCEEGLARWDEQKLKPTQKTRGWMGERDLGSMSRFYKCLGAYLQVPVAWDLATHLAGIQAGSDDWVAGDFLGPVLNGYNTSQVFGLGLVRLEMSNREDCIQLTPEGWYIARKELPASWGRTLEISADFELFIPHTYDPFVISTVGSCCPLVTSDYFLIYDASILTQAEPDSDLVLSLCEILFSRCRNLPDLVSYEVARILGARMRQEV